MYYKRDKSEKTLKDKETDLKLKDGRNESGES